MKFALWNFWIMSFCIALHFVLAMLLYIEGPVFTTMF